MPELKPKKTGRAKTPPVEKPAFQTTETGGRPPFGERVRAFRRGGLGRVDSFFNALYIDLCERAAEKGRKAETSAAIRVLSALPRAARSFFRFFTPSFWKRNQARSRYHRKRGFLKAFLPYLAVAAFAIFSVVIAAVKLNRPVVMSVEIDGVRVGVVESEEDLRQVVSELETSVEGILGRDFAFPYPVRYVFTTLSGKTKLSSASELSDALYAYLTDYICTGSGLYLDDSLVAVAQDRGVIEKILGILTEEFRTKTGDPEAGVFNEVQIRDQAYPTSSVLTEDELYQYLSLISLPFSERGSVDPGAAAKPEPEEYFPAYASFADTQFSTAVVQQHSNYPLSSSFARLAFYTTEKVTYEVDVPYITEYDERADRYTSMNDVTTVGVKGRDRIEAKIYLVDGKEARRDVLSETVLKAPVNEVISSGIKVLPEDLGITGWKNRFIMPRIAVISSPYGDRGEMGFHSGWDILGREGDNIYAAASGTVVGVRYSEADPATSIFPGRTYEGYGLFVLIQHDEYHYTLYAHCSKLNVRMFQQVKQGDKIAEVGNTGHSFGAHCHFEISIDGQRVNPGDGYMYSGTTTIYDLDH